MTNGKPVLPSSTLLVATISLLKMAKKDDPQWLGVQQATGVQHQWLYKVVNGQIREPGVVKVEAIYRYLTQRYDATDWAEWFEEAN